MGEFAHVTSAPSDSRTRRVHAEPAGREAGVRDRHARTLQVAMHRARTSLSTKLIETGLLRSKGLIDGKWVPAASGQTFQVHDPASGGAVAAVSAYGEEDTKLAVSAAEKSFSAWRSKTMQVKRIEQATCSPICILFVGAQR